VVPDTFTFWVGLPPGTSDQTLLRESAGLAEPLLDLRYGSPAARRAVLQQAVQEGLAGLTVFADARNADLMAFLRDAPPPGARVVLSSPPPSSIDAKDLVDSFRPPGVAVAFEVDDRDAARQAAEAGADFLVASGSEAYGPVSPKTTLILIQELLDGLAVPLVIRGSLGPLGAAGAQAAGCAGCILDSQLLLTPESPLSGELKRSLAETSPLDTAVVGALLGRPHRLLRRGDIGEYRALVDLEKETFLGDGSLEERVRVLEAALEPVMRRGFSEGALLPVGQGIAFAQAFAEAGLGVRAILERYHTAARDCIARVKADFPFAPHSALARRHGVTLPIVQGPMAAVTDHPGLAAEVARGVLAHGHTGGSSVRGQPPRKAASPAPVRQPLRGALPFVAAGGLSADETRRLVTATRAALGNRPFGVGLIAFGPLDAVDEQIEAVLAAAEARPAFVTVAGGTPALARRFEEAGIGAYLHAPSPSHVENFLDHGVTGLILEGHEAGGHVGALGSLVLWELGVQAVLARGREAVSGTRVLAHGHTGGAASCREHPPKAVSPAPVCEPLRGVLLAGGIATARGSLTAAVLASPLADRGVAVGLQLGTAYLMTEEAVAAGAIPAAYRQALLAGRDTIVAGSTVNLPARWLLTDTVRGMIADELAWEREGLPLRERKRRVERLNLAHLHAAIGGRVTRPSPHPSPNEGEGAGESQPRAAAPHPAPDDADAPADYLCGQVISVVSEPLTVERLHEAVTTEAQRLAEACPQPEVLAHGHAGGSSVREVLPRKAASPAPVRKPLRGAPADIPDDAVAIVGLACIFPDADDADAFWRNILNRLSAIREVPPDRWDPDRYYDPDPNVPDRSSSKLGAFIEGFEKDPVKFRIPPVSAPSIDRLQFLALEVAHRALADAGYLDRPFPRERTAVILGVAGSGSLATDYCLRTNRGEFSEALASTTAFRDLPEAVRVAILDEADEAFRGQFPPITEDSCPGVLKSVVAGRIANFFDLGEAPLTVDGACASSLAAVRAAVQGLQSGQYDMALAGGADTRIGPDSYVLFSKLGALSDKGSFPFDERADGFILAEGVGMVVLKRWRDARRDGDRVYAIIRGIGSSGDGRARSVTAPDVKGQVRALERAYERLPFGPDSLALVEAHGTATWAGDEAEIASLTEFFGRHTDRKRAIALGSVKSMIGHLKAAAGVAGLIKAALALHHRVLPPTINCERPRRDVDWENSPFYLITEPRPWVLAHGHAGGSSLRLQASRKAASPAPVCEPLRGERADGPRRVGVDSFGFGGVNFHVVLEEAPGGSAAPGEVPPARAEAARLPAEVLIFRAGSRDKLWQRVGEAEDALRRTPSVDLHHLALDLQRQEPAAGPTLAIVAANIDECLAHLEKARHALSDPSRTDYTSVGGIYYGAEPIGPDGKVAFLFPGQGAQYVNMVGDLADCFPFVRDLLHEVDAIVGRVSGESIIDTVLCQDGLDEAERRGRGELLLRTDYNHPALLALGVAIARCLEQAGIRPAMVAGHSVGEYAALQAAGVFSLEGAVALISARGSRIHERCFQRGAMASISAPADEVEGLLDGVSGFVTIANRNCPAQTVISGDVAAVEEVLGRLEALGLPGKRLPVSSAFHTAALSSCVEAFRLFLDQVSIRPPSIPVQSNLTGRAYEVGDDFDQRLRDGLAAHMVRPVAFIENVESMYEAGARVFLEIGPGSTLCSFVDNILADRPHWTFPTNVPRRSPALQLLHALAFCAARGLPVDLDRLVPGRAVAGSRPSPFQGEGRVRVPKPGPLEAGDFGTPKPRRLRRGPSGPSPQLAPRRGEGDVVAAADLVREALADQDAGAVDEYVRRRAEFLKSMVRLDFQHHAGDMPPAVPAEVPAVAADRLQEQVIDLVARKTGYPPDVIDIDLDVEAELGLDSIKQVEIVRELERETGVELEEGPARRYAITTLRDVIERLRQGLADKETVGGVGQPSPAARPRAQAARPGKTGRGPRPHEVGPPAPAAEELPFSTACHRWVSEMVERPLPGDPLPSGLSLRVEDPDALRGRRVLLLSDEGDAGEPVARRLVQAGATIIDLRVADASDDLPPDIDVVIDLWSFGEDESPTRLEMADWWTRTERRAAALLSVAQHLARSFRPNPDSRALWVEVTSLGGELGAAAIDRVPAGAGIGLGLSRCLLSEFPDRLDVLYLDFDTGESEERVAACVLDELTHERRHAEVGYAQGRRFEIRWKIDDAAGEVLAHGHAGGSSSHRKRAPKAASPAPARQPLRGAQRFRLDAESVVLAVGGARGITATICRELAGRSRARFVIVGKSPAPEWGNEAPPAPIRFEAAREALVAEHRAEGRHIIPAEVDQLAWERVWAAERLHNMHALRSLAGEVVYRQCDITDADAVRRLVREVRETYGRLDLVIQGGGALVEKSIEDFRPDEFVEGMKAKALGTACLLAALSDVEVGAFINLASIAGRWGNMGQSCYAAGHEVAAILVAGARARRPGRWINVFYGPWLDVGMVRIGAVMERLQAKGTAFVTERAGSTFLAEEFEVGPNHSVAFCGDEPVAVLAVRGGGVAERVASTSLLDEVEVVAPGVAEGRRRCDATRDRFIAEHIVGREPILPGVVALEMMAQTAAVLADAALHVTDIRDFDLVRAVRFPHGEPRLVRTRARRVSEEGGSVWFRVDLFTEFRPPGGEAREETVHARCRIRFGERQPPPRPSLVVVQVGLGDCRLDVTPLWETRALKARVGAFRNVRSVLSVTPCGVVAEVLTAGYRELGNPPLTDNPIRLDGSVFFVDFLTAIYHGNSSHYVDRVDSIAFYASGDASAARLCRCRVTDRTDRTIRYDIEAVDGTGRVMERFVGVRKAASLPGDAADLPERIWQDLRENPQLTEIAGLLGHPGRLALAHVRLSLVAGALEADDEALLRDRLAAEEIEQYRRLTHPKRRLEWLAGRLAAKGAVGVLLGSAAPAPAAMRIVSLPDGAPRVVLEREGAVSATDVSISHSGDLAVAAATADGRVGIDVETIAPSIEEMAEAFCAPEEVDRVVHSAGLTRLLALTSIWCAKEAARKVLGPRTCSMQDLRLQAARPTGVYVVCDLAHAAEGTVTAVTFQSEQYIYAVSLERGV